MSRKITSLLVLAVAALLAIPTQAQTSVFQKKAVTATRQMRGAKVQTFGQNAQKQRPADLDVQGLAFTGAVAQQAAAQRAQENQQARPQVLKPNQKGFLTPSPKNKAAAALVPFVAAPSPLFIPTAEGATKDANGIITAPAEGEHKHYTRAGTAYYANGNQIYYTDQGGNVEIVETADGVVYVKDLISLYNQGTWVEGTKVGNTITIKTGQPVRYNANYATTLSVFWGNYDENSEAGWNKQATEDITFTVEGDVITLQGSNADLYIGIFWDDDNSFAGYGDYETVWTYNPDYKPASTDLVEAPADLQAEQWYTKGNDYAAGGFQGTATVGFSGNEVYIKGIFTQFPDSWIKGTVEGTTVTFSNLQFQGTYYDYNIWAAGYNRKTLCDFTFTYDAAAQKLTLDPANYLVANAADDKLSYLQVITELTIMKEEPTEPVIETGAPVDALPYINDFDTAEKQAEFGIYDANGDGSSWAVYDQNFSYYYNGSNNANDWLVSPAIKLEAGKRYHFALDVWTAGYPERIEVKLAAEAKASVLAEGQDIIEAIDVDWSAAQTLENEAITVAESGYYHVGIHAISDADMYRLYVDNFLFEAAPEGNAPAAVENLAAVQAEGVANVVVTFNAPAKAIDGSDLTENLTKIDIYRDGAIVKTVEDVAPAAEVSFLDEGLKLGNHTYQVIPYNANGVGLKSAEVSVKVIATVTVPYVFDFNENLIDLFSVIDNNEDGSTWNWAAGMGAYYRYSDNNTADDYLVTLPYKLQAGKNYKVVMNARASSSDFPERFEVLIGKEPTVEGLNTTVIAPTELATTVWDDYEGVFSVAEDGEYYVAIHAISDPYMYFLEVMSLGVVDGPDDKSPVAPVNFTATPAEKGALQVVLSSYVPSVTYDGSKLTGKVDIQYYRDGELLVTRPCVAPNPEPNIPVIYLDRDLNEGETHTYYAVAVNDRGESAKTAKVTVYVGPDQLGGVEQFSAEAGLNTITFDWSTAVGQNGGYIDVDNISYAIYAMHVENNGWWSYLVQDEQIGTAGANENSATFDYATEEGEQRYQYFGISANDGTTETDPTATYDYAFVGAAYELPVLENFENSSFHWLFDYSDFLAMNVSENASDEDGIALLMLAEGASGEAFFKTGKLNINGIQNPTLLFDVRSASTSSLNAIGSVDGGEDQVLLANVPVTEEYTTVKVPLTALQGTTYAQAGITAYLNDGDSLVIDNIKVIDLYQYDLSAKVKVPASVKAGETANIVATIKNEGENAAKDFTVTIKAGEDVLLQETVSEALAPFKEQVFTAELPTTVFADAADVTITATVDYDYDLNPDNNAAEAITVIKEANAPQPENVTATVNGNNVELAWQAPSAATQEITDDAEDYDDDENGGLDADNHIGNIGEWTTYDGNHGLYGYGFNGIETQMGMPGAWMVFNPSAVDAGLGESYPAHSGVKYFLSACCAQPEDAIEDTDHWLISPELPGVAQTLSFYVRELVTDYGAEKYEILYSTTTKDIESFQLLASVETSATEWEQVSYDLPEGTKFFAIRHISNDVWGLMVDDITFTQGGGEVASYNIYVDEALNQSVDGTQLTATIANLADGKHKVSVSAVSTSGAESKPVSVEVVVPNASMPTAIESIVAAGKAVDVYSIDGKLVRQQTKSLTGLKGVYVIEGKAYLFK